MPRKSHKTVFPPWLLVRKLLAMWMLRHRPFARRWLPVWRLAWPLLTDFLSLMLLGMSGTMFVDFTRRLLNADPDKLGVAAIGFQAALTVAASSTFTKRGTVVLSRIFGRQKWKRPIWRLGFSAMLALIVFFSWQSFPAYLSRYYNRQGYALNHSTDASENNGQTHRGSKTVAIANPEFQRAEALRSYKRAAALDPSFANAHLDTGALLEFFYRYDEAAEQYRQAILSSSADSPSLSPYSRLARLQLLKGNPQEALRVIADAQAIKPHFDKYSGPSLYRSRAWAEYGLGFYNPAIDDGNHSQTAAGTCIAAKATQKLGQTEEARALWARFETQFKAITPLDIAVEPDCPILAEEAARETR
jgi:tetratricopeptide (TPR) repeat protein